MNAASRVPRSHAEQLVVDPLREHDRQPGVDPQPAKMGDCGKLPGDLGQPAIGRRQRVAAAENDLFDRRIGGDLPQDVLPRDPGQGLNVRKMPPEAETAMDGTDPTCYDQEPAFILSQKTGRAENPRFVQGIGHELRPPSRRPCGQFLDARQDLQQQRIQRIAGAHAGQIGLGNEHAETRRRARPRGPATPAAPAGGKARSDRGSHAREACARRRRFADRRSGAGQVLPVKYSSELS